MTWGGKLYRDVQAVKGRYPEAVSQPLDGFWTVLTRSGGRVIGQAPKRESAWDDAAQFVMEEI